MKNLKINIHSIVSLSEVNGPGRRTVFWVQGCPFNCPGCFNGPAREQKEGRLYSIKELLEKIPGNTTGITLSGGEPFQQAIGLALFCNEVKKRGLSVMIYTGHLLEELRMNRRPGFKELLARTDILIDGRYEKETPPNCSWAGSGNQRVHFLTERYKEYENSIKNRNPGREILITPEGNVIFTGFE